MSGLQLHFLGSFSLLQDGRHVAGFEQARLQHLLAYLVLHRAAPLSRQQLAFTFWPDTTDQQALKNLRTLLTRLRSALRCVLPEADHLVDATAQTVQWREDAGLTVDVIEFERALAQAEQDAAVAVRALAAAAAAYTGDLLPDCYDDWILPLRDHLRRAYGDALKRLARLLEERREYGSALQVARCLLQHDPLDEAAYHNMMRLHLALGDRTETLRTYRACQAMLAEEFGTRPGPQVQELYERLHVAVETPAPRSASEGPGPDLPLVGRQPEWARLLTTWNSAAAGRPQIVLVTGEAGIGKTRLAEELCAWATRQGAAVAVSHCYPEGAGTTSPYAPVTEWLRSEALRTRLAGLPDVWLAELARIAPALTPAGAAASGRMRAEAGSILPGGAPAGLPQQTLLPEALARAVLGTDANDARRPLLLFLDDMQWCDQETLAWLGYLLHYAAHSPLLLVATVRKDEIDTRHPLMVFWLSLARAGLLDEILLAPLDAAETAALAASIAGTSLDTAAATRLYRHTEGNPLFVVETVRGGLAGAGLEAPGTGGRTGEDAEALILPVRVRAVIRWRLAQLSPSSQALAQVAAAIGRQFSLDVLVRATGQDEAPVLDGLDELWRRHLVRTEGDANRALYDFSHDGIRAVAYDELGPIRRRAVHLRIARALEELDGDAAQLAHHYEQAGQVRLAITYYRRAAEASRRIHATATVAGFLRRLVESTLSAGLAPAEQCEIMLELAEVWRELGEWPRMEALSRDALALADTLGEPATVARAEAALADALQLLGYYDEALDWLAKAEAGYKATGDERGVTEVLRIAAEIDLHSGSLKRV